MQVAKKCRLIAVRTDKKVARSRRNERRKKAAQAGQKPCRMGLIRDGWHLMPTNLKKEEMKNYSMREDSEALRSS